MLDLDDIADVIASAVREATEPLEARIKALEAREPALPEKGDPGPPGDPGKDADMAAVRMMVDELTQHAVREQLADALKSLPPPEKGEPGRDVDMEEVATRIETAVKAAVEALPPSKEGAPGKDGLGLADAFIDRDGALVLTMTDGSTRNLGLVVGTDGKPGKDGETFTLDDFDIEPIDERTIKLMFTKNDVCHSFELCFPVPVDRGVWKEGAKYERGDGVTWAGSFWIAQKDAPGKPETADSGWRMSVRRGRDGKDAPR